MMKYRLFFFFFASLLLLSSCSVSSVLNEGDKLYVGMKKARITSQDRSAHGQKTLSGVEAAISAAPNNAFFGSSRQVPFIPPIGLWIHNKYSNDSTRIGRWIYKKFASKPVTIRSVNPENRCKVAVGIMRENGYFHSSARYEVIETKRDSLKAHIRYFIDMGPVVLLDSVHPLPVSQFPDSTVFRERKYAYLKKESPFSLENLLKEREDISATMRDQGYYFFSPDAITYEADSLNKPGWIALQPRFVSGLPQQVFKRWHMRQLTISIPGEAGQAPTDSIVYEGLKIHFYGKNPLVRPGVLRRRILLQNDDIYSQRAEQLSRQALSQLGAFGAMDFRFSPAPLSDSLDASEGRLDLLLSVLQDKPWDVSLEMMLKTKSNNFVGPRLKYTMAKRNLFGGGERLSFDIYGSYEWQTGRRPEGSKAININSYEFGSGLNLTFPGLLWPGQIDRYYLFPTSTTFGLTASLLNRAGFFRMVSLGLQSKYEFQPAEPHRHQIVPLKLNYNLLQYTTPTFDDILRENPALELSLRSHLIPQMGYIYTYSNRFSGWGRHHLWMEYGLFESGNLLNTTYMLFGKDYSETKDALGVPFSQFIKLTAELRYTYRINRKQSLATRLGTGLIYSYGNARIAPYSEQFYVGGANSIRAFTVRSVGPGYFIPQANNRYAFIDQTGDVKLELNAEYRFKLLGSLDGAAFLDAGNVWLIRQDENRPGGAVRDIASFGSFLDQLALGTGLGLRYDLDFLVVRLDCGIGLHLPYDTGRSGYYNIPSFRDALGVHFAIGYPF
ncbi:translocation and assembly module lipoprotein TamL [Porphyromonas crevioricanis]|uniref:translocation and assembly module lipoprotein TamL n=1 Tax=Porphyromonas crevioricanis TaxID=393921 RepID=UPI000690F675|nr:BamA/TamA family outer membrane protein [Porphyromonas crevioricanis]